jgi:hypothetical protein
MDKDCVLAVIPEINTIIRVVQVVVPLVSSQVTLQTVWLPHLCIALCIAIINMAIYYSWPLVFAYSRIYLGLLAN